MSASKRDAFRTNRRREECDRYPDDDEVRVATSGTIDRDSVPCSECGRWLLFRVDGDRVAMLCGNVAGCSLALKVIPEESRR